MEYIINTAEDKNTGETGMVLQGLPFIDYPMVSLEGLQISHDILEHVNGVSSIGTIEDELEALAGVWFIRGQFGKLRRDNVGSAYSAGENLASDVFNMFEIWLRLDRQPEDDITVTESDYSDDMDNIMEYITIDSLLEHIDGEGFTEDYTPEYLQEKVTEYYAMVVHYLNVGAEKINAKFSNMGNVNCLFWDIAEAIDKQYEEHIPLKLTIDYEELTFDLDELWEY